VVELVRSLPEYRDDAARLSKAAPLRFEALARSIAAYVETLSGPGDAAFDRYSGGDRAALSESAKRGYEVFRGRGNCTSCHDARADFTDGEFHSNVLSPGISARLAELSALVIETPAAARPELIGNQPGVAALGRFVVTLNPRDIGRFRTPTLRNVALTAPYMHDGSVATLEEAVAREAYASSVRSLGPVRLTPAETKDVVEFLRSLTSSPARRGEL
jgi:cytochrome c peroxidase